MNAICDIALLRAFTSETPAVGAEMVREALGVLELSEPAENAALAETREGQCETLHLPPAGDAPALRLRRAGGLEEPGRSWWTGVARASGRKA
jgi:hypothetical protein